LINIRLRYSKTKKGDVFTDICDIMLRNVIQENTAIKTRERGH